MEVTEEKKEFTFQEIMVALLNMEYQRSTLNLNYIMLEASKVEGAVELFVRLVSEYKDYDLDYYIQLSLITFLGDLGYEINQGSYYMNNNFEMYTRFMKSHIDKLLVFDFKKNNNAKLNEIVIKGSYEEGMELPENYSIVKMLEKAKENGNISFELRRKNGYS